MTEKKLPFNGQTMLTGVEFDTGYEDTIENLEVTYDVEKANAVTSIVQGNKNVHKPIFDVDLPIYAIPSSTEGHFHVYIDHEIHWDEYVQLLRVLARIGIVEQGYADACIDQGFSTVRAPWVKKGAELAPSESEPA